jgi:hypothetical protein
MITDEVNLLRTAFHPQIYDVQAREEDIQELKEEVAYLQNQLNAGKSGKTERSHSMLSSMINWHDYIAKLLCLRYRAM